MKQLLNKYRDYTLFLAAAAILTAGWVVYFHNESVASKLPKWNWLQGTVHHFGMHVEAVVEAEEDPDNTKNEIPVHVGKISVLTVRRYIEGYGVVTPQPARQDQPGRPGVAGSANIAAPVAGIVAKVACQIGQKVRSGDLLIQLDERLAKSAEDQARASLAETDASLALLQAPPKPNQLEIAQLGIEKAKAALAFSRRNLDRQKELAENQASSKNVEQATLEVGSAENDLAVAERQLAILKSDPSPEELRAAEAKVRQAAAALTTATQQRQTLTITSPLDATIVGMNANPGESVDPTRVLIQLISMDRLMVDVDVPADQLPADAEGLPAQLMSGTGPIDESKALMGKITFVSPQVEPKNGSVMVGIDLPSDAPQPFRPGLTLRVRIIAEEHKDALVVPRAAVVQDENRDNVISIVDANQAKHHTVKVGLEENGMIEISPDNDVKEGVSVVTDGAFGLRETQQTHVKVVE